MSHRTPRARWWRPRPANSPTICTSTPLRVCPGAPRDVRAIGPLGQRTASVGRGPTRRRAPPAVLRWRDPVLACAVAAVSDRRVGNGVVRIGYLATAPRYARGVVPVRLSPGPGDRWIAAGR